MLCCTSLRHLLKPAAWFDIYVDSRAAFSHFLSVSWLIVVDAGAGVGRLGNPTITAVQLHWLTASGRYWICKLFLFLLGCSPYHYVCNCLNFTNWSFLKPPAPDALDGDHSTKVTFSFSIFLQSHSMVHSLTLIVPCGCCLGAVNGFSSAHEEELSMSGMCVQPIYDLIPHTVSRCDCSSERVWLVSESMSISDSLSCLACKPDVPGFWCDTAGVWSIEDWLVGCWCSIAWGQWRWTWSADIGGRLAWEQENIQ